MWADSHPVHTMTTTIKGLLPFRQSTVLPSVNSTKLSGKSKIDVTIYSLSWTLVNVIQQFFNQVNRVLYICN